MSRLSDSYMLTADSDSAECCVMVLWTCLFFCFCLLVMESGGSIIDNLKKIYLRCSAFVVSDLSSVSHSMVL